MPSADFELRVARLLAAGLSCLMASYVTWSIAAVSAVMRRSSGCSAFQVNSDQAQFAGVALAVFVSQPAVVGPGEHLGEPRWLAGEVGCGAAAMAAQNEGEYGAVEVDVDGLEFAGDGKRPSRQAEVACPAGGVLEQAGQGPTGCASSPAARPSAGWDPRPARRPGWLGKGRRRALRRSLAEARAGAPARPAMSHQGW